MWHRLWIYPILLILSAFLLTVFPNSDLFAQCIINDRAEGLISSPDIVNKFGNPRGLCIVGDPSTTFATYEIPTYAEFKNTYYTLPSTLPQNLQHGFRYPPTHTPAGGTAEQIYFNGGSGSITGNSVYHINGNLTLNSPLTMPASTMLIVFVDKDLTINTNLNYADNNGGIVFIVKGNININYLVSNINAVLISAGIHDNPPHTDYSICTAYDGGCPSSYRRSTSPLTVNGTLASICADPNLCANTDLKPIRFRRSINDNSRPAEIINFQAKYLVLLRESLASSKKIQTEITDYDGATSFSAGNVGVGGNNYPCQDQCTSSTLVTGMVRDAAGFCNASSGISRSCPSAAHNNQTYTCGGLNYTCNNSWILTATPSPSASSGPTSCPGTCTDANGAAPGKQCSGINTHGLGYCAAPYGYCSSSCVDVICNATPVCSATCTAPANSCTTNNGTKTCTYTTNAGRTDCTPAPAPNQTCTQDSCTVADGSKFCSATTCTSCNSGLLSNGCFENTSSPSAGWGGGHGAVSGTATIDSTVKHSGNNSYKITSTGAWWGWQIAQGGIAASRGEHFCLSGWVKKVNANDDVSIAIQESASPWQEVDLWAADHTNWQELRQTVTVGSNWTTPIGVFARVWDRNHSAWFDDISLTRGVCSGSPNFPTSGLAAYWRLDEPSGIRYGNVGGNLNETGGGVGYDVGRQSNAARFTGDARWLTTPDSSAVSGGGSTSSRTYAAWVYLTNKGDQRFALSKYSGGGQKEIVIDYLPSTDRFRFVVSPDGYADYVVQAHNLGSPQLNTWYLVIGWFDNNTNTLNIQINNRPPDSVSYNLGIVNGPREFAVGSRNGGGNYWVGLIDEVGIWNRALTASERTALYGPSGTGIQP